MTDGFANRAASLRRSRERIRRYWAAAGFWSYWVGALHEFVGWFLGRVPLDHLPSANITIDAAAVSNGQFGIARSNAASARAQSRPRSCVLIERPLGQRRRQPGPRPASDRRRGLVCRYRCPKGSISRNSVRASRCSLDRNDKAQKLTFGLTWLF